MPSHEEVRAVLSALAAERRGRTFCPSEAARRLVSDWRPLMPVVREVAAGMDLVATQGGVEVDALAARGPIRLSERPR